MEKFKAYRIREVDKKIVARFEELALEDLDNGEVVARVAYSSVNYKDALAATRMEANGLKPANGPVIVSGATGGVGSIAIDILSRLGYHVVALTGKDGETDYLRKLGAKEVLSRKSLDLSKIKPLDKATWAGAIDNLGGEVLAWMAST